MNLLAAAAEALSPKPPWYRDLCDYYGVCPAQALALGTRAPGRRPLMFGGRTFEEIWESNPRNTPEGLIQFWSDLGPWLTFRQVVRNRCLSYSEVFRDVPAHGWLGEWGCGVAPVTWWGATHGWRHFRAFLTDVASEPFQFAEWRLRRIDQPYIAMPVMAGKLLPLPYSRLDVVTCFEVFEHVEDPVALGSHLLNMLPSHGVLWEDFVAHDHPHAADLQSAQEKRKDLYVLLQKRCTLTRGQSPWTPGGGGRRRWLVK